MVLRIFLALKYGGMNLEMTTLTLLVVYKISLNIGNVKYLIWICHSIVL